MNGISGESRFSAAAEVFLENFATRGEVGASISVWRHGREILSLAGGATAKSSGGAWTADTPVPVWSATKGPAAFTLLLVLHENGFTPHDRLRPVWPELNPDLTFGELLSHQSGLCALDLKPAVTDHTAVIRALELQVPAWPPGTAHGYHPRTFGFLADECVRRLTGGQTLAAAWRERVAIPLELDFWMDGPPDGIVPLVARLYPGKVKTPEPAETSFFHAMADSTSLTRRSFASPTGFHAVADLNQPSAWRAGLAAFGGVGTSRALAKFYNVLACGGLLGNRRVFPAVVTGWAGARQVNGWDQVLCMPTSFSNGFMMDPHDTAGRKIRKRFGPATDAFGHPGAGGSHAFADPSRGLSFAYVMNQMEQGVLPHAKSLLALEAIIGTIDADPGG